MLCYVKLDSSHPNLPYRTRLCMLYRFHRSCVYTDVRKSVPVMTAVALEAVASAAALVAALVAPVALPPAVF